MVKRVGKYEIGRTLGEGTFGKCVAPAPRAQPVLSSGGCSGRVLNFLLCSSNSLSGHFSGETATAAACRSADRLCSPHLPVSSGHPSLAIPLGGPSHSA
jgi:hypothetical protein